MTEINPYASPRENVDELALPILPSSRWHELDLQVVSVIRGWWRRKIALTGTIEAEIEYDPRGQGERVYVNGRLVATTSVWVWENVAPHIDFFLDATDYRVPASIDVKAIFLQFLRTAEFRLTVADRVLYVDK